MDDYHLKYQTIAELREATRLAEANNLLFEKLTSIVQCFVEYKELIGRELPNQKRIDQLFEEASAIVKRISPEVKHSHFSPEDETEPRFYTNQR